MGLNELILLLPVLWKDFFSSSNQHHTLGCDSKVVGVKQPHLCLSHPKSPFSIQPFRHTNSATNNKHHINIIKKCKANQEVKHIFKIGKKTCCNMFFFLTNHAVWFVVKQKTPQHAIFTQSLRRLRRKRLSLWTGTTWRPAACAPC